MLDKKTDLRPQIRFTPDPAWAPEREPLPPIDHSQREERPPPVRFCIGDEVVCSRCKHAPGLTQGALVRVTGVSDDGRYVWVSGSHQKWHAFRFSLATWRPRRVRARRSPQLDALIRRMSPSQQQRS